MKKGRKMPYKGTFRSKPEFASKTGHIDVIKNPFVRQLIESFLSQDDSTPNSQAQWQSFDLVNVSDLPLVFAVDGSYQVISSEGRPRKELGFVKTALLCLNEPALDRLDKKYPHPEKLKKILERSALYHSTVFPLRGVRIPHHNTYHGIRRIIYDSIKKDPNNQDEVFKTLKWIVYRKWRDRQYKPEPFGCPHCNRSVAELEYDRDEGPCPGCGQLLYLTDWLGLHTDLMEDAAPESVARYYMLIHEILLLITGVRLYWEKDPRILKTCLFIKDGPLSIRASHQKIAVALRDFFRVAKEREIIVHLIGQEKTGAFVEHLEHISVDTPNNSFFIPSNKYILEEVLQRPSGEFPYGYYHSFGSKVFVKLTDYHKFVFSIPTGGFVENPNIEDFIGFHALMATLPRILSFRYENALLPIELANGIASLSTYPSAHILSLFALS